MCTFASILKNLQLHHSLKGTYFTVSSFGLLLCDFLCQLENLEKNPTPLSPLFKEKV